MINKSSGFTLLELVTTVTIVSVVIAIAIPNFVDLIKSNRLSLQVNDLVSSINLARSEAVKRGLRVTMCKSNNGTTCVTTGNWAQGWIVFTDPDNTATRGTNETIIKVMGKMSDELTITSNVASNSVSGYISYVGSGLSTKINSSSVAFSTITICDDRSGYVGKSLIISGNGRPKVGSEVACNMNSD